MAEKGLEFLLKQTEVAAVVTLSPNNVNYTAHGLSNGDPFILTNSGGSLPSELAASSLYYAKVAGANAITIHATKADAIAGAGTISFTGTGTGTHSAQKLITTAGMRSTAFTLDGESVEITTKDSAGWKTLKAGAGVIKMSISAAGVFQDDAAAKRLQVQAIAKTLDTFTIRFESGDEYWGLFQVLSVENAGEHNGEVTYSMSLESSGVITPVDNT